LVAYKSVAHELRPQRAQVHHASSAHKWADEANHKINRMVRRQNAQVTHPRPERIPGRERLALLQIVLMREHASFGTPARARGINDASHVLPLPRNKLRVAFAAKILPPVSPR